MRETKQNVRKRTRARVLSEPIRSSKSPGSGYSGDPSDRIGFMQFLPTSLMELITQTSTNLPPDDRAAMALVSASETPDTQSSQALGIILSNIDMAVDDEGSICKDTVMLT